MMQLAAHVRLGQVPRSLTTSSGKPMAAASGAVKLVDRNGDEHTFWIDIIAFGKLADLLLKHAKGELVSLAGRCQWNSYTTSGGEDRGGLQVVLDSLVSARTARPGGGRRKSSTSTTAPAGGEPFNDDMTETAA